MIAETRPLAAISQEAIRLLYRELGVVNTVRFLRQFTVGFGNYTEERNALFGNKSLDEIVSEIKASR
jgi:hypothetical protein